MDALIAAIATIIGAIITVLVPKLLERRQQKRRAAGLRSVCVDRIQDPAKPEVFAALRLYERRIPAAERDDLDDIVRWLREVRNETKIGTCKLEDYFLIARAGSDLAGFAYLQFYPAASLAFFSYMVVDESVPETRYCTVSTALVRRAREALQESGRCRGILFEVDEPEVVGMEAAARIKHFQALARMAGCSLKTVRIRYVQPKLSTSESAEPEIRMRLMYAPLDPIREPHALHKRDVGDFLEFLGTCIYGDHFEHRMDLQIAYRKYLTEWKTNLLKGVPEVIQLD